jgi:hypothetical protein
MVRNAGHFQEADWPSQTTHVWVSHSLHGLIAARTWLAFAFRLKAPHIGGLALVWLTGLPIASLAHCPTRIVGRQ